MNQQDLTDMMKYCKDYTMIPIWEELFADVKSPIEILENIRALKKQFYILESVERGESWGRFTFLGVDPDLTLVGREGKVIEKKGGKETVLEGDPLMLLKQIMGSYKSPKFEGLPPFTGGFVGYFSYEVFRFAEPSLKLKAQNRDGFDDFCLMMFDKVIAIDHFKQKIYLIVNMRTEKPEENFKNAKKALKALKKTVLASSKLPPVRSGLQSEFSARFDREGYRNAVEKARHHIYEGDIFQCVPANRFTAKMQGDLMSLYRVLRTTNPSPYLFYIQADGIEAAGASPETLVSLKDGIVTTYPLAGTCPRGADAEEDRLLIEALLSNEKELSEHDMLVDLGRNDLGKICQFGSVQVEEYRTVKKFSHVSHIASKVTGHICAGKDALDAVLAVLPAGTLSGAPKKRACEIIDEIEGETRGIYGGAVGYIDFTGNADLCIGIRTAVLKDGTVYVQAGGGIVADSDPDLEYQESLNKAGAVLEALKKEEDAHDLTD